MFIHEYTSITSTLFTMCRSLFSLGRHHHALGLGLGHGHGHGHGHGGHTSEFPF